MARTLGIPARVAVGFTPGIAAGATARCRSGCGTRTPGPSCTSRAWAGPASSRPRTGARCPSTPAGHPGHRAPEPGAAAREPVPAPSAAPSSSESCTAAEKKLERAAAASLRRRRSAPDGRRTAVVRDPAGALWRGWAVLAVPLLPMLWRMRARSRAARAAHGRTRRRMPRRHPGGLAGGDRHGVGLRHRAGRLPDAAQGGGADRPARASRPGGRGLRCTGWPTRWSRCSTRRGRGRRRASPGDVRRVTARPARPRSAARLRLRALLAPRSAVRVAWAASERLERADVPGHGRWRRRCGGLGRSRGEPWPAEADAAGRQATRFAGRRGPSGARGTLRSRAAHRRRAGVACGRPERG